MKIDLSGGPWQMRGYWPYTPLFGRSMETGVAMGAVTHWMPARVPGCVMNDLLENGVIEDPHFEMNSLRCEWVENRWWVYRTEFASDGGWQGQDIALVFSGIDYKCHIFLNHEKLCEHEGMFEPIRLDITEGVRFDSVNVLEVVLESPPDEMGQIGYTSRVRTQTSRFGYKWDYSTRMVHSGIWQDVYLEVTPGARIANTHVVTSLQDSRGVVDIALELNLSGGQPCRVLAALMWEDAEIARQQAETQSGQQQAALRLTVDDPRLWWPSGYGGQPLYALTVELWRGDVLCDRCHSMVGIRSLAYDHNEGAPDALPYVVKINGRPIYLKGVNISPLDHRIGSVSREQYARLVERARDAHVNMIRVWGGGVTEKEEFYDLCDRMGILVWQEFNQSSSGIDNVPPKDERFLELLRKNATASILARRNHVCLALWNGGNELMDVSGVPSTYDDANIAMLRELTDRLDPQRLFLPTSASGPREFLDASPEGRGGNHDVHGPWQYQGPRRHYEMYNQSDSLLHSEFGADAFTNLSAARRFLSQKNLAPSNVHDNLVWRHHGEWWDTTSRDRELFGERTTLGAMILCSQFVQAEGLRYAVESNRRRAFQSSGSIIWQLNEPWPNLSCTNLVDYYGQPKPAYWWVKRAYGPLSVSLRHDGLLYEPGAVFTGEVWVCDDVCAFDGAVTWRVLDMAGQVRDRGRLQARCGGSHAVSAGAFTFAVEDFPHGFFMVELSADGGENPVINEYLFTTNDDPAFGGLFSGAACADVTVHPAEDGRGLVIENPSDTAALFVILSDERGEAVIEDNGFMLAPGRTKRINGRGRLEGVTANWLNRREANQ